MAWRPKLSSTLVYGHRSTDTATATATAASLAAGTPRHILQWHGKINKATKEKERMRTTEKTWSRTSVRRKAPMSEVTSVPKCSNAERKKAYSVRDNPNTRKKEGARKEAKEERKESNKRRKRKERKKEIA